MTLEKVGWVVLFHLDPPYKHARHVYDFMDNGTTVGERIGAHLSGDTYGPALLLHALRNGSKARCIRKWEGTRSQLSAIRRAGNAVRHCKECRRAKKMEYQDQHMAELLERSVQAAKKRKKEC